MNDRSNREPQAPISSEEGTPARQHPTRNSGRFSPDSETLARRLIPLAVISIVLLFASLGGWQLLQSRFNDQNQVVRVTVSVSLQTLAAEYPELANLLQDPKLDSAYKDFLVAYQEGGEAAALELAEDRGLLSPNGDLRLTLELDTTDTAPLEVELEANFIEVTAVSENLMDIAIPVRRLSLIMEAGTVDEMLANITNLEHIVRIRLPRISAGNSSDRQTTPGPGTTPSPIPTQSANATPGDPAPVTGPGGIQMPRNLLMLVLGGLLCVVAPALFAVGAFLLLSGLGVINRNRRSEPAPVRPSAGTTPGRRPVGTEPPRSPTGIPGQTGNRPIPTAQSFPRPSASAVSTGLQSRKKEGLNSAPAAGLGQVPVNRSPAPGDFPVSVITCPECQHENRSGAHFCAACGKVLLADPKSNSTNVPVLAQTAVDMGSHPSDELQTHPSYCWNCGGKLRPTSVFCPHCGDRIELA